MRERRRFRELSRVMVGMVPGLLTVGVTLLSSLALAQEKQAGSAVDTEHIFGFTEGADIGATKANASWKASPSDV